MDNGSVGGGSKADAAAAAEAVAEAKATAMAAAEAAAAAAGRKPKLCFETRAILTSVGSSRKMQMDLPER